VPAGGSAVTAFVSTPDEEAGPLLAARRAKIFDAAMSSRPAGYHRPVAAYRTMSAAAAGHPGASPSQTVCNAACGWTVSPAKLDFLQVVGYCGVADAGVSGGPTGAATSGGPIQR
jgi:hypothetical protein